MEGLIEALEEKAEQTASCKHAQETRGGVYCQHTNQQGAKCAMKKYGAPYENCSLFTKFK